MNYQVRNENGRRPLLISLATLLLSACIAPPPKQDAMPAPLPQQSDFVPLVKGQWPAASWWKSLHDAQLNQLIEQALAESPSMAVAQARVAQANAAARLVAANTGAKLDANASLSRTRYSEHSFYPPPIGGSVGNDAEASVGFSYDFDFWGRNRAVLQAALGRENASQAEAAGAAATLASAVASAYFEWQTSNARISAQQQIISLQSHWVELEGNRVRAGLSAGSALTPLKANLAAPQQLLVQLQTQRDQLLAQLRELVGSGEQFPNLQAKPLPTLQTGLPERLPLDLVSRRADVLAARDRVTAAGADVDAARAAYYPDINLSAVVGLSSMELSQFLDRSSLQAGITPAIHLPLFDAGRLQAGLSSRQADSQAANAEYRQTLLHAISEINDAATRAKGAELEAEPLNRQIEARRHDLDNTARLVKAGLSDGRALVAAQLSSAALTEQDILRQGRALQAHIDLVKALGGGFQAASEQ